MFRRFFTVDEKIWSSLSSIDIHTFQLGLLTRTWAVAEGLLDMCCDIAFRRLGGDKNYDQLPRTLDKRLNFLRRVLMAITDNDLLKTQGVVLVDCASEAADFRNLCVHGIVREDNGSFIVGIFKRLPLEYQPEETVVTHKNLAEAQMEATMLTYAFLNILISILHRAGFGDVAAQAESQKLPLFGLNLHPYPTKRGKRIVKALQALSQG
jgi:hypothetical protein